MLTSNMNLSWFFFGPEYVGIYFGSFDSLGLYLFWDEIETVSQFIEVCCHFHGVFKEKFLSTILWTDVENMIQMQVLNLGVDFQNLLFLSFNRCCT